MVALSQSTSGVEKDERSGGKDKLEFDQVRWMEISSYLQKERRTGRKLVKPIEFTGEPLDMASVYRWHAWAFARKSPER